MGLMVGVPMFLVLQEPDLGHTLMIGFIGLVAGFERFERRTLIVLILIALVGIQLCGFVLRDYQKDRILTLIDGRVDRLGAGWHANQAKVAVGSGGVLGKGYGEGTQVAGGFLPETILTSFLLIGLKSTVFKLDRFVFVPEPHSAMPAMQREG